MRGLRKWRKYNYVDGNRRIQRGRKSNMMVKMEEERDGGKSRNKKPSKRYGGIGEKKGRLQKMR